jgi:alkylation response protein AidB-like acyl-CoA dehydrogenase
MDLKLSPEQQAIQQQVQTFSNTILKPLAADIDKKGCFPKDIIKQAGKLGFMGMTVPKKYGGSGMDPLSYTLVLEEIARVCGSTALTVEAHNSLGIRHLYIKGTEEQRKKYLPHLTTGAHLAAWALTEAHAGSDAAGMQTTATREGDEWVLNGSKIFITSGKIADVAVVMAKTDKTKGAKGISAFIVEKDTPGFTYGVEENKLGLRGTITSELLFENCHIPHDNLLGDQNLGFIGAMEILDAGRTAIGAMAVGIAQGALDESISYVKKRQQFKTPLSHFQAIQWMIADMATYIEAARLLVRQSAYLEGSGKKFTKEASMAKLFASSMATQVTKKAIQLHGGYGYMKDRPLERFFRDVKLCEIGEGTSEIQRLVISRQLGL